MERADEISRRKLQSLHDLNMELLWANLEALREVRDYCRKEGIPSPQLDEALNSKVRRLLDLVETIAPPDERKQEDYSDWLRRRGNRTRNHEVYIPDKFGGKQLTINTVKDE